MIFHKLKRSIHENKRRTNIAIIQSVTQRRKKIVIAIESSEEIYYQVNVDCNSPLKALSNVS